MRTFILSLLILLFAAAALVGLPPAFETIRAAALIVLGLWLVGETRASHSRHKAATARDRQATERELRLRQEHDGRVRELEGQVALLRTESVGLKAAQVSAAAASTGGDGSAKAKPGDAEVVGFLALLQQKGRFLDFIMDDVTRYPDAQIGAAARVVHQGCAGVVREYFDIKPVHDGQEGGALTLPKDYDARRYRLLGRVTGEPPLRGRVLHRGWLTTGVRLPERIPSAEGGEGPGGIAGGIIAPAEVELA